MSPIRLMDQVRNAIRVRHYSLRTEQAYTQWIRRFIYYKNKTGSDLRNPLILF